MYGKHFRWQPLADFVFSLHENFTDDNTIYCLCSRALIKDVKYYWSDARTFNQNEEEIFYDLEDYDEANNSNNKTSFEADDVTSNYYSHTENCSTDDGGNQDLVARNDSGTDLNFPNKVYGDFAESFEEDNLLEQGENYLSYDSWQSFWHDNGERLIWTSWLEKYGEYVDPEYLDEYKTIADAKVSLKHVEIDESMRDRKYSYDSKLSAIKKNESVKTITRQRSISEQDQLVNICDNVDSMTNVTKMSQSSHGVLLSSHDSESSCSYVSAESTSSLDETEIYIECDDSLEEQNNDDYWQKLWWQHFDEQHTIHFANYNETHLNYVSNFIRLPDLEIVTPKESLKTEEQDLIFNDIATVIEINSDMNELHMGKSRKRRKNRNKNSLSNLVNVLRSEAMDGCDKSEKSAKPVNAQDSKEIAPNSSNTLNLGNEALVISSNSDDDDEPPEERPTFIKRSHEEDAEETPSDPVEEVMSSMGLNYTPGTLPCSKLVYRKRMSQILPPKNERIAKYPRNNSHFELDDNSQENMETDEEKSDNHHSDDTDQQNGDAETQVEDKGDGSDAENGDEMATKGQLGDSVVDDIENQADLIVEIESCDKDDEEPFVKPANKRDKRKKRIDYPEYFEEDKSLKKYWRKRHSLFSKFDLGIRLDKESWFSVTPERVASHIANRCRCDLIIDAFCGAAGNTIQFAKVCERVIAIDVDPLKIELARNNARIYGVEDRIEFIVGDFFELAPTLKADVVFLSPPWGGPEYTKASEYDVETMLQPKSASLLLEAARIASDNVAVYLPRTSRTDQLVKLAGDGGFVEVEQNFLDRRFVAVTAYYGELVREMK